jgi:hypothetical protein
MPPARQENLIKKHYMVDKEDNTKLEFLFAGKGKIGVSKAVRIAIRRFLIETEDIARRLIDKEESK